MAVTGMANLAVKVADLDAACAFYDAAGAEVRDRMHWNNGERADVYLGPVMITLFTHAIYEDAVDLPAEGFLHPRSFTDDLDAELDGPHRGVGPGGRRGRVREAAHRVRRGAGRHPARVHGAAGGPRSEGDAFPSRVGEQQRHAARRRWSTSTATCSGSATSPGPRSPASPGTGTRSATRSCTSSARRRRAPRIDPTGHHYCVAVDDLDAAIAELEARGHRVRARGAGRGHGADLDRRPGRQHDRAATGDPHRVTFTPYDRPVRAAFVGLGRIYDLNVRAYLDNPDVEVVALVDPSEERRARAPGRLARRRARSRRRPSSPRAGSRSTRSRRCCRSRCTSTA